MSFRDRIGWWLWRLGIATLARRILVDGGRFALNFHGVSTCRRADIPTDLQPHHSRIEFRAVLSWLAERFEFLSAADFFDTGRPGVLLTFDDGHANNLTNILPLLQEFKAVGIFFVSTQHVLKPRDWLSFTRQETRRGWGSEGAVPEEIAVDCFDGLCTDQLAALGRSEWAVIGAHTVTHPSLPACDDAKLAWELTESRRVLQAISGQAVDLFAYPYGDYDRRVAEAAQRAGYRAAFAVDPLPVGLPAYEIPRLGIYAADPAYLSLKVSGLYRRALRGSLLAGAVPR